MQFDRHKRVLGDYIKRGYVKKYEDAFADLEKTAAALPADQADQFRGLPSPPPERNRSLIFFTASGHIYLLSRMSLTYW